MHSLACWQNASLTCIHIQITANIAAFRRPVYLYSYVVERFCRIEGDKRIYFPSAKHPFGSKSSSTIDIASRNRLARAERLSSNSRASRLILMAINGLINFFFLRLLFCFRTTVFSDWWQDSVLLLAKRALGDRCRPPGQFKWGRIRAFPSTASLIPLCDQ